MLSLLRSFRRSYRRSRMEGLEDKIRRGANRRTRLVVDLQKWTREYDALRAEFANRPDKAAQIRAGSISVTPR